MRVFVRLFYKISILLDLVYFRHGADEFLEKGITNGAAWYSTIGTLQDYEYIAEGIMAFTLELGCQKTTSKANLPVIYSDARDAMIDFMLWLKIFLKNKIEKLKFNLTKVAWVHGYPRKSTR